MKIALPLLIIIAFFQTACNSGTRGIFSKKTLHEKYAERLDDADLDKTPQGRAWLAASQQALTTPLTVSLPYSLAGYFHTDKPRALGLQFSAKVGEQLRFKLTKEVAANFVLYADLYQQHSGSVSHLMSVDTNDSVFQFNIPQSGNYTLRIQPELARTGAYELSIAIGPSLAFPVSGTKAKVGSVWGDSRDGGKRAHEGIDIFAPKGTPAVAVADGRITSVREGGIGGKTVWLRPEGAAYTLYYAHLDEQLVQEGQVVKSGDVIGKVGNTGNAQTTPAHLHFGVYGYGGAIDPLPFVAKQVRNPSAVPDKSLKGYLKLTKQVQPEGGDILKAGTLLVPVAVQTKAYVAEGINGNLVTIPFASAQLQKEVPAPTIATSGSGNDKRRS